jgi:predicted nucleic acid-binding protein
VTILVDTDVLLDVALDRAPHATASGELLDWLEQNPGTGFVAWHTISNFYYLVIDQRGQAATRQFITDLVAFADVAPTSTDSLRYAARLAMKDFEDAMQVAAAAACQADVIATRNLRDFRGSPIPAMTPTAILAKYRAG